MQQLIVHTWLLVTPDKKEPKVKYHHIPTNGFNQFDASSLISHNPQFEEIHQYNTNYNVNIIPPNSFICENVELLIQSIRITRITIYIEIRANHVCQQEL